MNKVLKLQKKQVRTGETTQSFHWASGLSINCGTK